MMDARSILLALISAAVVGFADASQPLSKSAMPAGEEAPAHRSLAALRADVHAALRAEAAKRRDEDNLPETIRLIELFHELAAHPQRDESATLGRLGQQLRSRLTRVRDQLERQRGGPDGAVKEDAAPELLLPENRVLAQQMGWPGGAAPGAAAGMAGAVAAAGGPNDFGPDLVALIQQTISPATWDINGGNGSVVYYAPLRVLVIRAPADVHHQVGGVLAPLRADR